ncbi:MAG: GAF domain-containing sensor histidine kinase, partial [Candidatus Dormibacteraeota bacterium]|nr:GAF domain-containing sensor histidine kinase [Candidatus Dormibacteraeota bacterium]
GIGSNGAGLILAGLAMALRFRSARGEQRQQLRWVATVALFIPLIFIPLTLLSFGWLKEAQPVVYALTGAGIVALPLAVGLSVLRYRLYDIDIVISRTVVFAALAVFVTAVYLAIVVGVGALVGSGDRPNLLLSIAATAVVALAFQPVRSRAQVLANRIAYGKRATPYEVLSDLSAGLRETFAGEDILPRIARVLAEGTGATRAAVWVRVGDELRAAAVWPTRNGGAPEDHALRVSAHQLPPIPGAERAVPVLHQGDLLGALAISKRPGEPLTPMEENLLADLAAQAGLVLRNAGLASALQARLEDLRESRQRLVAAQDEERRRLERNLHDGAQQNLVALKVKLGLAKALAARDPEKTEQVLDQLAADADEAIETLRDLARGIYPPLLADKGLAAALESQARKATLPVTVDADGLGRYPQEVEAAVYFCALEALQNVQKYADAGRATVRLRQSDRELHFEVDDDGRGFDPSTTPPGSGLQNMADRIDALGGTLAVDSELGRGTRVTGAIGAEPTPLDG